MSNCKVQIAKKNGEKMCFLLDLAEGRSYNLLKNNEQIRRLTGHTGEAWCQNMLLENDVQLVCDGVHRNFNFANLDIFEKGKEKRNFEKRIKKVRRWVAYIRRQNFLIEFPALFIFTTMPLTYFLLYIYYQTLMIRLIKYIQGERT